MSKKYILICVEGNHDQAFVGKILKKILKFNEFNDSYKNLDRFWRKFIPSYPPTSEKLYVRLDMPSIFFNDNISIGVYAGEGSNLVPNLKVKLSDFDISDIFAVGIIADADKNENSPTKVAENYCKELTEIFPNFPNQPGIINNDSPKLGIYVLPNNFDLGVLDTLLLKCGKIVYPEYLQRAKSYINEFSEIKWKNFDKDKAIIAAVASVLKPGKTNTTTIKDDKWVSEKTYNQVEDLKKFVDFLNQLLS